MSSEKYGFNPRFVEMILNDLQVYTTEILGIYYRDFQNDVIVPLSETWYAPEAQIVVRNKVGEIKAKVGGDFVQGVLFINDCINQGAISWANAVGDTFSRKNLDYDTVGCILDDLIIKSDNNGFRGIISEKVGDINVNIEKLRIRTTEAVTKMINSVSACDAFIGAQQMEDIVQTLRNQQTTLTKYILEDINELKSTVDVTMDKYQQTAQTNAQRFASGN